MLVGIGLMSTLAASITSYFVQQSANTDTKDLAARLDRIETILARLSRELTAEADPAAILTQMGSVHGRLRNLK